MANSMTLNIKNASTATQSFFIFQQPAGFTGGGTVYSTSLFNAPLLPYASSGAVLTVSLVQQPGHAYAGAQQSATAPAVGQIAGGTTAMQDMTLSAPGAQTPNTTQLSTDPLGLSPAIYSTAPAAGTFRIVIPSFNAALQQFNAGTAIANIDQSITLSSFVSALPLTNLDCQPTLILYVQTGVEPARTIVDFTAVSQNAARCDFTPGYASYAVTYAANGTWSVTPYLTKRLPDGREVLVPANL
ncbi:MAG: hypothetical protein B7Z80_15285 [Rhodospirillales bacterium 20-64-7]|nr:MAG: hypothetical protein B7Z80_15285 [Rhodospirillales bacterium 20-64-7]